MLCPPPGDLLNPGIEPSTLMSPALVGEFFTSSGKAPLPTSGQPHWLIGCDELLIPWHVIMAEHTQWQFLCKSKTSKIQSLLKI